MKNAGLSSVSLVNFQGLGYGTLTITSYNVNRQSKTLPVDARENFSAEENREGRHHESKTRGRIGNL
jgi:hypothetical protein